MAHVFVSHSSNDNDETKKFYKSLEDYGINSVFLDFDKKKGILLGENWEKVLYKNIKDAKVIILLLSPSWCSSRWCFAEYTQARALGKDIYPIIIEQGYNKEVDKWVIDNLVQKCDLTNDPNEIYNALEVIKNNLLNSVFEWDEKRSPYPGMISFEEADAAIFFGRDDDIIGIVEKLKSMRDRVSSKFLNIIAASGMGKSSLLKAGIIPKLKKSYSDEWAEFLIIRPTEEPLAELVSFLCKILRKESCEEELYMALKNESYSESLKKLFRFNKLENKFILLSLDQAEELYSISDKEEKKFFMRAVSFLLKEREEFFMLWTLRSDFLKAFQTDNEAEVLRNTIEPYILSPIKNENITDIILKPAKIAEVEIDNMLVDKIKNDIKTTDALPLLALCLNRLYIQKKLSTQKQDRELSIKDYQALAPNSTNPLEEIIQNIANKSIQHFSDNEKEILKKCFIPHMVSVNNQNEYIKKEAQWEDMPTEAHSILEALVKARLLIKKNKNDFITIEIVHEALIRNWSLLKSWIEEEYEFLLGRSQLVIVLEEWEEASDDEKNKALLSGLRLQKAAVWLENNDSYLNQEEKEFIQKSIDYSKEQEKKFEDLYYIAQEEEKKAKHYIGLVLVEKANKAYDEKDFRKAVGYSYGALESLNSKLDEGEARILAKNILINSPFYKIAVSINTGTGSSCMAVSEDRGLIISGHGNANIKLWSLLDGHHIHTFLGDDTYIMGIDLVLNDTRIVSTSMNAIIQVWDIENFKLLYTSDDSESSSDHLAKIFDQRVKILNDKEMMIYLSGEYIKIIDFESGEVVNQYILENYSDCTSFISDVKNIFKLHKKDRKVLDFCDKRKENKELIRISNGSISLYDRDEILINRIYSDVDRMYESKDEKTLIISSVEKINIFDMTSAKSFVKEIAVDEKIFDMTFSNMNKNLYINNRKNIDIDSNKIFDVNNDCTENETTFHNQNIIIRKRSSCEVMIDDFLEISDADDNMVLGNFYHGDMIFDYTISDDQKILISSSLDGTIKVWCMQNYVLLKTLDCNAYIPYDLILSDNNKYIYSSTEQGYVFKWDIKKGKKILETFEGNNIKSIVLSGDKKKLVSLIDDQIKIRNIDDFKLYHEIYIGKKQCDTVVLSENNILAFYDMNARLIEIMDLSELAELDSELYIEHEMFLYENKSLMCIKGTELINEPKVWEKALWSKSHPFHWLDKAKCGDNEAMYQLGLIYDKDNENGKALEWYDKARNSGCVEAKERIEFLKNWMKVNPINPKQ